MDRGSKYHGRPFAAVLSEVGDISGWERAYTYLTADTPSPIIFLPRHWAGEEEKNLFLYELSIPASDRLTPLIRSLQAGEICVEADGDRANQYTVITVPVGFWRVGLWIVRHNRLIALAENCDELPPAYYNPRLIESPSANIAPPTPAGAPEPNASFDAVKKAIQAHGKRAPENELRDIARRGLPGKKIPRILLRRAITDVFGPGQRGRSKTPKKSAEIRRRF